MKRIRVNDIFRIEGMTKTRMLIQSVSDGCEFETVLNFANKDHINQLEESDKVRIEDILRTKKEDIINCVNLHNGFKFSMYN